MVRLIFRKRRPIFCAACCSCRRFAVETATDEEVDEGLFALPTTSITRRSTPLRNHASTTADEKQLGPIIVPHYRPFLSWILNFLILYPSLGSVL